MTNTNKNGLSLSLIHSLHYFILFFLSFLQFIGLFRLHIFTLIIRLVSLSFTVSLSLSVSFFLSLSSTLYITLSCSLCLSFLQFIGLCRLHIFTLIIRPVSLSLFVSLTLSLSLIHSLHYFILFSLSVPVTVHRPMYFLCLCTLFCI